MGAQGADEGVLEYTDEKRVKETIRKVLDADNSRK
jgi:hypothetical protein